MSLASLALMLRAVDALGGRVPAGSRLRSRRHHRRRPRLPRSPPGESVHVVKVVSGRQSKSSLPDFQL